MDSRQESKYNNAEMYIKKVSMETQEVKGWSKKGQSEY